jgi:hypothetical protein
MPEEVEEEPIPANADESTIKVIKNVNKVMVAAKRSSKENRDFI